jgi:GNAT superfamily N-acetyltransferase
MVTISALSTSDSTDWLELWQGYLTFYLAEIDQPTTEATFDRLTTPGSGLNAAIARDEGGRAVGIVHWLTHPATWTTANYCYLEDLFVSASARGTGTGRALIEHVRAWAEQNGSTKVYWLTEETNAVARALYDRIATKSGFTQYQIQL